MPNIGANGVAVLRNVLHVITDGSSKRRAGTPTLFIQANPPEEQGEENIIDFWLEP